jgi:hypothetical protein
MKFSISLPTGFEGVMYPVRFVDSCDFVVIQRSLAAPALLSSRAKRGSLEGAR